MQPPRQMTRTDPAVAPPGVRSRIVRSVCIVVTAVVLAVTGYATVGGLREFAAPPTDYTSLIPHNNDVYSPAELGLDQATYNDMTKQIESLRESLQPDLDRPQDHADANLEAIRRCDLAVPTDVDKNEDDIPQ